MLPASGSPIPVPAPRSGDRALLQPSGRQRGPCGARRAPKPQLNAGSRFPGAIRAALRREDARLGVTPPALPAALRQHPRSPSPRAGPQPRHRAGLSSARLRGAATAGSDGTRAMSLSQPPQGHGEASR